MRVRRRLGEGFEALELPRARGSRPVSPFEDFQINQRGELPRRGILEAIPPVPAGPPMTPAGFDRNRIVGMLDAPTSQIGRSILLDASAGNGNSRPLIQARCSDERARQLTIFLSVENNPPGTGLDRDIVGLLSWGAGGMMISGVEFDFVNGAVISIIASFIQLNVRSDTTGAATNFQVGAFMGYESRGGGSAIRGPQRTLKVGAVAAATPEATTIPRFATSFSFIRSPLAAAITLSLRDGIGNVMGIIPIAAGADVSQRVFPIPGDAMDILVTTAAADVLDGRFVFGLSL